MKLNTNTFEPIAIIGQGCVLPGCFSPQELWLAVLANQVNIGPAEEGDWGAPFDGIIVDEKDGITANRSWHHVGGYVKGFQKYFNPAEYPLNDIDTAGLDPVFQWSFYAAKQALASTKYTGKDVLKRTGIIMGNLSYPTRSFSTYYEQEQLKALFPDADFPNQPLAAVNRFMSGLPAQLTAKVIGAEGEAFALDAACASSLYALKLACDQLHSRKADMMLAGGVCAADQLFLHTGFTALKALSPTGQSRPFNTDADGLIPGEGAAFIVIKRFDKAVKDGDNILGVIRSVGLSNDGRSGGFLSPAKAGQVQSMKNAFAQTNISPKDISFIECHATGTGTGDSIEIESLEEVYNGTSGIAIGSLKANLGHSITASGAAGIIKVLGAFASKTLPATPSVGSLSAKAKQSPFNILTENKDWDSSNKRLAAISNFGFGGNNAHLLLEEYIPGTTYKTQKQQPKATKVAVVKVEVAGDRFANAKEFLSALLNSNASSKNPETVEFCVQSLTFPPNDLKRTLGQQLLILKTAEQLIENIELDKANTGVFIGMGADADVNRYGFMKRLDQYLQSANINLTENKLNEMIDTIAPVLNSAAVIGTMPNIPANRINNQFNISGVGYTVSAEDLSGVKALEIAVNAIINGELKSAIVGAVDLSNEMVHQQALKQFGIDQPGADTAVALLLKDYDLALTDGDNILATIATDACEQTFTIDKSWLSKKAGYSHAADGLLQVATAVLLSHNRLQPDGATQTLKPFLNGAKGFSCRVAINSRFGGSCSVNINSELRKPNATSATNALAVFCFSGNDKDSLIKNIKAGIFNDAGIHRLAIVSDAASLKTDREKAVTLLEKTSGFEGWLADNICYRFTPIVGETAFTFTGAASAYPQMGKDLLQAFPSLAEQLAPYCFDPAAVAGWAYDQQNEQSKLPFYQLAGSSFMCQVHAVFSRQVLGLKPQAAIGLSSGETNSMFAMGVWEDMDLLLKNINASTLYTSSLGVHFDAVKTYWDLPADAQINWENWRALAPLPEVEALVATEDKVYLTIVNTYNDCVFGGDAEACRRIIEQIGQNKVMQLYHDIAVHCPAVLPYEREWRELHTRPCKTVKGIRFYSNYLDGVYETTSQNVAEALTGQAVTTVHFPKIIEKAWADGVRIFVEHGPRNSLSLAIKDILKGKPHLCVSFDQAGKSSLVQAYKAAAELWAAAVAIDLSTLTLPDSSATQKKTQLSFPLHMPQIKAPIMQKTSTVRILAAAPKLVPTQRHHNIVEEPEPVVATMETNQQPAAVFQQPVTVTEPVVYAEESFAASIFVEQHRMMTEAHESYMRLQMQSQQQFSNVLQGIMSGMMGQTVPFSEYTSEEATSLQEEVILPPTVARVIEPVVEIPVVSSPPPPVEPIQIIAPVTRVDNSLPGPKFSRQDLEVLSSGKISSIFGELFEKQDQYAIQVRMPEPPLLLCDRVTGIKGEPGTLGLGTIWTETDVTKTSWYLHNNRMPPGIFIEAGQADLLLISWLGIDFQNKGERSYRLLGCELTFYGELPQPGETLKYNIHVDGYAKSGETALFFFHYDCHIDGILRISVRNGQAGFFSVKELDESKGVIWDAGDAFYETDKGLKLPNATHKLAFNAQEVTAYTQGDMVACFGPELIWTQTHTRSPRSQSGYQNFIGEVTAFDLQGGPGKRGYLRAESLVTPSDWYFKGHFKNDECMPGTLMADACLQMMSFYMVGAGLTVKKDGWRFEPVTDTNYKFVCRGQVTPTAKKIVYEIFIVDITDGPMPTVFAHVLTTVDGNKAFLCEKLGLRLVPDYPINTMPELLVDPQPNALVASNGNFKYNHTSLINCALGKPSDAFGPDFDHYDGIIRSPRLPGPPYHFMTRITEVNAKPGEYKGRPHIIAEYDLTPDEWYFHENGKLTMPYGVLMEVALQPCGWFSTFICQLDIKGKDLLFRNLDGDATQHREITPADKTIVTKTTLTSVSIMGAIIIVKFEVMSTSNGEPVYTMNTVFGFFDPESMINQKGLAISDAERNSLALAENSRTELKSFPAKYFTDSTACLPASKLLMIDRVTTFYPEAGRIGKGYIRAEKNVVIAEWFFKAHFFQDPVQPGSLGIEAMVQLLQFYMLQQDLHARFKLPVFEPIAMATETEWHYRGQVTPDKKVITTDFDVIAIEQNDNDTVLIADARLWVDGLKIYHAPRIAMRIKESN